MDWTKVWSKKYPVLQNYQTLIDTQKYSREVRNILNKLKSDYNLNETDSMLVLKDILYKEYLKEKNQ